MPADFGVAAVAHVISLAVAPVFLLTGVCTKLMVLTNRLARIIDRSRVRSTKADFARTSTTGSRSSRSAFPRFAREKKTSPRSHATITISRSGCARRMASAVTPSALPGSTPMMS